MSKLYGTTATYLVDTKVENRKISETYQVNVDELAEVYSDLKNIPVHLNADKRREIYALAHEYLKLKAKP